MSETPEQLAAFLDLLTARGAEFSQDFPDSCIAMKLGVPNAYQTSIVAATRLTPECHVGSP